MRRWLGIFIGLSGLIWVGWCEAAHVLVPNQVTSDQLGRYLTKGEFTRDEMFHAIVGTGQTIKARLRSPLPGVSAMIVGMILMGHPRQRTRNDA